MRHAGARKGGCRDAVAGAIDHVVTTGVRGLRPPGRGQRRRVVRPVRHQPQDRLQVAGPRGGPGTALADRSRRPLRSPAQTPAGLEARVLALRGEHPAWGGRKLQQRLDALGMADVPAPSTITGILPRHGLLDPVPPPRDSTRFEHAAPTSCGRWTSRATGPWTPAGATADACSTTTRALTCGWRRAPTSSRRPSAPCAGGLSPLRHARAVLTDNGPPWGTVGRGGMTALDVWLLRAGSGPGTAGRATPRPRARTNGSTARSRPRSSRSRPCPTRAGPRPLRRLARHLQPAAPARGAGLRGARPAATLPAPVPSQNRSPRRLRPGRHGAHGLGPRLDQWRRRRYFVSRGLAGEPVAVRPTLQKEVWEVVYCHHRVATVDPRLPGRGVTYVPAHLSPISPVCTRWRNLGTQETTFRLSRVGSWETSLHSK